MSEPTGPDAALIRGNSPGRLFDRRKTMRATILAILASILGVAAGSGVDTLWVRRLDLGSDESGVGIDSRAEAIAVAGYAWPSSTTDWLVVRLNQSGNIIWTRTYDSGADDFAYDACVDSGADIHVTGFGQISASAGRPNLLRPRGLGQAWKTLAIDQGIYALTAKYGSGGDLKWLRTDPDCLAVGIAADSAGNSYVSGTYLTDIDLDLWLAKFNPAGETIWTRTFNFAPAEIGYRLALDASGNIAACAYIGDFSTFDILVLKLTPDGDTIWTRVYDRAPNDAPCGLAVDPNNSIVVAGATSKDPATGDALILKYDSSGVLVWDNAFDFDEDDGLTGAACDSAGNIYVAGYTGVDDVYDCLTMKLDSTGNVLWTATYGGPDNEAAADVACDGDGNPVIAGFVTDPVTHGSDLLVAKYSPFTGSAEPRQANPTPVRDYGTITAAPEFVLSVPCFGRYEVRLCDLTGRARQSLFSGFLSRGAHRFSLGGQPAGHYFVRVAAPDGGVSCQRLVIVR